MTTIESKNVVLSNAESSIKGIKVHMVYGTHITTPEEDAEFNKKQEQGDLTATAWKNLNGKLPSLLSIDGLSVKKRLDPETKKFLLKFIPKTDKPLMVVAGDPTNSWRDPLREYLSFESGVDSENLEKVLQQLDKNREAIDSSQQPGNKNGDILYWSPGIIAALAMACGATIIGTREIEKAKNKQKSALNKDISRRNALAKIGGLLGLAGIALATPATLAPKIDIKTSPDDSKLQRLINIISRNTVDFDHTSDDGRSAFLIENGVEAARLLGQDEVAVVAGAAHSHNIENLLSSADERDTAMVKYTRILLNITDEVAKFAGLNEAKTTEAKIELLAGLMEGQILKVNNVSSHVPVDQIDDAADDAIHLERNFTSPGVERALTPLLNEFKSANPKR